MRPTLIEATSPSFAAIALGHVEREWPNRPDQTMAGPQDVRASVRAAPGLLWQL
jgi:hypothetical protein